MAVEADDRIYPLTRLIAALVTPVLLLAFVILYLYPELSAERFAWEIKPKMTAAFMGAGYLGGAWLFTNAIFGRRWHRVAPGFLPVTTFTIAMLLATILHWSRFDLRHFPFELWLGLYVVTPFLVPWLWWRNRRVDRGTFEAEDPPVPGTARWGLGLLGAGILIFGLAGFIAPTRLIALWPWTLTPLTARVLSGWFGLLGMGGLMISRERRWSAWRVGLQSIALWHALVVAAALRNQSDFPGGVWNWYLLSVAAVLIGMLVLYVYMERRGPTSERSEGRAGQPS